MAHENATPRPWRFVNGEIHSASEVIGAIYRTEAWSEGDEITSEDQANAAFVLNAVNEADTLRAERDALREENERLKAGGWQPIKTAPGFRLYQNEDPIAVLLCAANEEVVIGYVALRRDGTRRGVVNGLYGKRYTHWMPLPKGPQS